ncbi:unnamed protein product [Cylicocyclus nassatus]|uniref:Uncharacterized protein n=1 Tax=Cylicocyclus nassatus TaxID=53992 RepID=A0AA36M621_CYLNA|nr:unnamed protein product [Cylicocyclus nassatus]
MFVFVAYFIAISGLTAMQFDYASAIPLTASWNEFNASTASQSPKTIPLSKLPIRPCIQGWSYILVTPRFFEVIPSKVMETKQTIVNLITIRGLKIGCKSAEAILCSNVTHLRWQSLSHENADENDVFFTRQHKPKLQMKISGLSRLCFSRLFVAVLFRSLGIDFTNLLTLPVVGARSKKFPCEYRRKTTTSIVTLSKRKFLKRKVATRSCVVNKYWTTQQESAEKRDLNNREEATTN